MLDGFFMPRLVENMRKQRGWLHSCWPERDTCQVWLGCWGCRASCHLIRATTSIIKGCHWACSDHEVFLCDSKVFMKTGQTKFDHVTSDGLVTRKVLQPGLSRWSGLVCSLWGLGPIEVPFWQGYVIVCSIPFKSWWDIDTGLLLATA